jgi:hypothetical protein
MRDNGGERQRNECSSQRDGEYSCGMVQDAMKQWCPLLFLHFLLLLLAVVLPVCQNVHWRRRCGGVAVIIHIGEESFS